MFQPDQRVIDERTALLALASGELYARLGASGFLVMAVLSASAVPLARGLRSERRPAST